jgi:hypothetical protein
LKAVGAKKKRWSLYVDESGNFSNPLDVVVVAALFLDDDSLMRTPRRLPVA